MRTFILTGLLLLGFSPMVWSSNSYASSYEIEIRQSGSQSAPQIATCNDQTRLCFLTLQSETAAQIDVLMQFLPDEIRFQFMQNRKLLSVTADGQNILQWPIKEVLGLKRQIKLYRPNPELKEDTVGGLRISPALRLSNEIAAGLEISIQKAD